MRNSKLPAGKMLLIAGLASAACGAMCACFAADVSQASAEDLVAATPNAEAWKGFQYEVSGRCAQCHAGPSEQYKGQGSLDLVLMAEYSIWKTHDKHAQAYAVLEGKRGKQMEEILQKAGLKCKVTEAAAGCLNCHAMANLKTGDEMKRDGVSCGGCHGPSSEWRGKHDAGDTWRARTAEDKFKLGLRDLRDPLVRAELCYSCHVGNAAEGKIVTHAMFAAGHPPLPPIEISTFSRNEPQHWRDAKDVPYFAKDFQGDDPAKLAFAAKVKNYHLDDKPYLRTKFALVGAAVALRETMKLVADRANPDAKSPKILWPELLLTPGGGKLPGDDELRSEFKGYWPEIAMATADCFACHHDLKYPGFRQVRGFGYTLSAGTRIAVQPGRPVVRMWPTALVEACAVFAGGENANKELTTALGVVAKACNARPFGEPGQIRSASGELKDWAKTLADKLNDQTLTRETILKLMHKLCGLYEPKPGKESDLVPDYEAAKQIAALLTVAYEDYRGSEPADGEVAKLLAKLSEDLNLYPYIRRQERGKEILDIVRRLTKTESDPKASEQFSSFVQSLSDRSVTQQKLDDLIYNRFLIAMSRGVDNRRFTDQLVNNQEVIDTLQKYSDEEEKNTLHRVATYDPDLFKQQLKALGKLLPAK